MADYSTSGDDGKKVGKASSFSKILRNPRRSLSRPKDSSNPLTRFVRFLSRKDSGKSERGSESQRKAEEIIEDDTFTAKVDTQFVQPIVENLKEEVFAATKLQDSSPEIENIESHEKKDELGSKVVERAVAEEDKESPEEKVKHVEPEKSTLVDHLLHQHHDHEESKRTLNPEEKSTPVDHLLHHHHDHEESNKTTSIADSDKQKKQSLAVDVVEVNPTTTNQPSEEPSKEEEEEEVQVQEKEDHCCASLLAQGLQTICAPRKTN